MEEFYAKSVDRVETLLNSVRRQGVPGILSRLQLMAILEQLPESEKRSELMTTMTEAIEAWPSKTSAGVNYTLAEALIVGVLGKEAVIGDQTRSVIDSLVEKAFATAPQSEEGGEGSADGSQAAAKDANTALQLLGLLDLHAFQAGSDRALRARLYTACREKLSAADEVATQRLD